MPSQTRRPGMRERREGWLVWDGDVLDPAAVGVSVGLVITAVGYLAATRTGVVLAVGLIVLGGVVVTAGVTYGMVRGGWGPGHRESGPLLARLESMRRQRDEARQQARTLQRELRATRGGGTLAADRTGRTAGGRGARTGRVGGRGRGLRGGWERHVWLVRSSTAPAGAAVSHSGSPPPGRPGPSPSGRWRTSCRRRWSRRRAPPTSCVQPPTHGGDPGTSAGGGQASCAARRVAGADSARVPLRRRPARRVPLPHRAVRRAVP